MIISGRLHRIDEPLPSFIARYLQSDGNPTAGFVNWGRARVDCVMMETPFGPAPTTVPFTQPKSFKADTDAQGRFQVDVPGSYQTWSAYLVVYTQIDVSVVVAPGAPPIKIPVWTAVFRSATFSLTGVNADVQHVYISNQTPDSSQGFTQAQVTAAAKAAGDSAGLDSISAFVTSNDVDVQASRSGAVVSFDLRLRASTSWNLSSYVRVDVTNFGLDLPGPDFITGICVDEAAIEKRVRDGVKSLDKTIDQQIAALIPTGLKDLLSVTVRGFRFPITKTLKVPMPSPSGGPPTVVTASSRSILADPCVGLPKLPYA